MEAIKNNFIGGSEDEADALLIAFAQEGPEADLRIWAERHPSHARDFARLAATRWAGEEKGAVDTATVNRLRDIGMATLRACRPAPATATPARPALAPLTHLLNAASSCGLSPDALAAKLEVPYGLLFKLHRRLLAPASLPGQLVNSLAEALNRTADEVAAYLRQPPLMAAGASYRSDSVPEVGTQETFEEALVDDPETTLEQKSRWLGDTDVR